MKPIETLDDLVGEEISAVSFVMDYVEIDFNRAILRCLSNPKLVYKNQVHIFPDPGSRDALCTLIGCKVVKVQLLEEQLIRLTIDKSQILEVPLGTEQESAHFVSRGFKGEYNLIRVFD